MHWVLLLMLLLETIRGINVFFVDFDHTWHRHFPKYKVLNHIRRVSQFHSEGEEGKWSLAEVRYLYRRDRRAVSGSAAEMIQLKIIDTIGKTHDTESIFSWDAFEMCSIDLTNFHNMLTGLSDRYWWRNFGYFNMGAYGKMPFWGITSPKPMTELSNFGSGYSLVFHTNICQNKISLTHLNNF